MKKVIENIADLIDLKSIITMCMIVALVVGFFMDKVTNEQFIPMVTTIITFYFARTSKTNEAETKVVNIEHDANEIGEG